MERCSDNSMLIQMVELPFSSEVNAAWFSCRLSLPPPPCEIFSVWNGMCMCYQSSAKTDLATSLSTIKWQGSEVPGIWVFKARNSMPFSFLFTVSCWAKWTCSYLPKAWFYMPWLIIKSICVALDNVGKNEFSTWLEDPSWKVVFFGIWLPIRMFRGIWDAAQSSHRCSLEFSLRS